MLIRFPRLVELAELLVDPRGLVVVERVLVGFVDVGLEVRERLARTVELDEELAEPPAKPGVESPLLQAVTRPPVPCM